MRGLATGWFVLGMTVLGAGTGAAQPIQSPQDAACRNEARARVFSTPDPQGLGPYAVGRQIYTACMQRAQAPQGRRAKRVKRSRR